MPKQSAITRSKRTIEIHSFIHSLFYSLIDFHVKY